MTSKERVLLAPSIAYEQKTENFSFTNIGLGKVLLIQPVAPFVDNRGYFTRTYDSREFNFLSLPTQWSEEYEGYNEKTYTVRGFHFLKPPHSQTKLIRVVTGAALFTILDIGIDSPTCGKWVQTTLTEEERNAVLVPEGFAVCICSLTPSTRLFYKMDKPFNLKSYGSILWNSPGLNIPWPVNIPSTISEKDASAQTFDKYLSQNCH